MVAARLAAGTPMIAGVRGRLIEVTARGRQAAILGGVAVVVTLVTLISIWASFGFRYTAFAAATSGADAFLDQRAASGAAAEIVSAARGLRLLPEAYLYGFAQTLHAASERAAFLNGRYSTTGWWWYFPYAFAVKTTIPAMALGMFALVALTSRRWRERLYHATPLIALVAVYGAFALTTNLNIGHRHLLPIYPALCVLAGAAALLIEPASRATSAQAEGGRARHKGRPVQTAASPRLRWTSGAGVAMAALLTWHAVESVRVRPHYLAYFNQFGGGPSEGYRHLADSSLDWGQGLPALKEWLDREGLQRPGATPVYLSYFGTARPEHYRIQATRLAGFLDQRPPEPPMPLRGGVYCISATMLNVVSHLFYEPANERDYQAALENLVRFARASEDERAWTALMQQTGDAYWKNVFQQFDRLRTGRLAAYLRHRQPDAIAGYSILIYRLSDAEVDRAVNGPAPGGPS
jgi:hypothetical protein